MTARRPKHATALQLLRLETRDVPATFYVDPALSGATSGSTQTFNAGQSNQVTGLVYGTTEAEAGAVLFPTLAAALAKAAGSAGADSVLLANGTINVDNSGGPVQINDQITLVGSGRAITILRPTTNTTESTILVPAGKSLSATALGYDGTGKTVGTAFFIQGATGNFTNVSIANVATGTSGGTGIAADAGASVNIENTVITGYDRIGVSIYDSMGSVVGSTITGIGVVAGDFLNYGIQVAGNSKANVVGSFISGNQDTSAASEESAGIFLYEDVNGAPIVTVTTTNFSNNTYGALIGFTRGADNSTATFTRNNFATSNFISIVAENNTTINARRNYFGNKTGPRESTANPNGQGGRSDDQVDFRHWLERPFELGDLAGTYTLAAANGGFPVYGLNATGGLAGTSNAVLGGWTGEIRTGTGDVNGDGVFDRIVGIGFGGGSKVEVYDGVSGSKLMAFDAYVAGFTGGVYVASGDVNGDGKDDIVTGAGFTGGGHVRVFDGATGAVIRDFIAYGGTYTGGVTVATADFDNDGFDDIVAGTATATTAAQSHVTVFSSFYNADTGAGKLQDFIAYGDSTTYTGGVFVAAGDMDGDGRADVITGAGVGGAAHVRVWKSNLLDGTRGARIGNFIVPGLETFTGGIRVAARDLDDDGCEDLIIGLGNGGDTSPRVIYASDIGLSAPPVTTFAPWGAYSLTTAEDDGLFVG